MASLQYSDVIIKPLITSKAMGNLEQGKYTFIVHTQATKTQIKDAVERMFDDVKVDKVRTMNRKSKKKNKYGRKGKTSKKKIAIITLKKGEIQIFEGM